MAFSLPVLEALHSRCILETEHDVCAPIAGQRSRVDVLEKLLTGVRTQFRILLNRFFHFAIGQILCVAKRLGLNVCSGNAVFEKKGGAAQAAPPGTRRFQF